MKVTSTEFQQNVGRYKALTFDASSKVSDSSHKLGRAVVLFNGIGIEHVLKADAVGIITLLF